MEPDPTASHLVTTGTISNADVEAAVTAYLAAPDPGIVPLSASYEVDITAAIAAHAFANKLLKSGRTGKAAFRSAIRRATLAARVIRR